jgi:flagellar assembly factor FliW
MNQLAMTTSRINLGPWGNDTTKVNTTRFGEIEVDNQNVITLDDGLIGFPEYKRWLMMEHDPDSPFKWFQSLEEGAIAFVMLDPQMIDKTYHAEITPKQAEEIALDHQDDAVLAVIITMPSNPQNMTANFKAPIVFNLKNRKAKQIILNHPDYTTRINVMERLKGASK